MNRINSLLRRTQFALQEFAPAIAVLMMPGGYLIAIAQPPSPVEAQKHGVHALFFSTDSSIETLQKLTPLIESGQLKPHVAKTYPLSAASQAWQDIATSHIDGKVVFVVAPE